MVINQGKFLRECLEGESVAQPAALKLRELYSAAMETERKRRGSVRGMQSPAAGKTAVLSVGDSAASEACTLQARPSPARHGLSCSPLFPPPWTQFPFYSPLT